MGAGLASLAIETRRLFMPTCAAARSSICSPRFTTASQWKSPWPNRSKIAQAHSAGFGLIYIDLDKFKPINDQFGHHVGDLYLQEVAARMNKQLLGGDLLARLGGDEFAAMVSLHNGRSTWTES